MLFDVAVLITSLGVILVGAGFFTNGIEWFGRKLGLNEGTIGSILAAVGTALAAGEPEKGRNGKRTLEK
jgi:hypothetical protein